MTRSRPTWGQRALLVAFGLGLVAGLEGCLRLAGFGGEPPLLSPVFVDPVPGSQAVWEIDRSVAQPFFHRRSPGGRLAIGGHRRDLVTLPEPPGAVRVLLLGASTVEGFPFPRNLTAARFFETWLGEAMPERSVEVINFGVTALASFPVRVLGQRAMEELDPDLVVVYAGHNQFFGAGGVASRQFLGRSPTAMALALEIRLSAIFDAVSRLVDRDEAHRGPENLIEMMAAVPRIPPGDPRRERARRNLAIDLAEIVETGSKLGIPVVLSTVASNERGVAPVASVGTEPPDPSLPGARERLEELVAGEPENAAAAHALAVVLADGDEARSAALFRRARDLDAMPWRAPSELNETIRRLAAERKVALFDAEERFAEAAGGPPGWSLFADHVHPSLRGQALLARGLIDTLAEASLADLDSGSVEDLRPWREVSGNLGANPLEHYLVVHKMGTLFSTAPLVGSNEEAGRRFRRIAKRLEGRMDAVDREAVRRWRTASRQAGFALPISYFGAATALRLGEPVRGVRYAKAARQSALELSDEGLAARALGLLGTAVLEGGKLPGAEVRKALKEAESVRRTPGQPTALTAASEAVLLALAGRTDDARSRRERAEALAATAEPWTAAFFAELPDPGIVTGIVSRRGGSD